MHSPAVPPARPPRRDSVGIVDHYSQTELPGLPPGAAPPATSYGGQPFGHASGQSQPGVTDRGTGTGNDGGQEERMDFRSFASPLSGLPPLLAPQAAGGMSTSPNRSRKPMPANIQSKQRCRYQLGIHGVYAKT